MRRGEDSLIWVLVTASELQRGGRNEQVSERFGATISYKHWQKYALR